MYRSALLLLLSLLAACPAVTEPSAGALDEAGAAEAFQRGRAQQLRHAQEPSSERLASAIEDLEQAARLDGTRSANHYYAARAREEHGDLLEAEAHYRSAVAVDAAHDAARWRLGRLLHQSGDLEGALVHLEVVRAVGLGENAPTARLDLGRVHEDMGELEAARDLYREAVALRKGETQAWFRLSHVLDQLGDAAGAKEARQRYQSFWELERQLSGARHAARQTPSHPQAHWTVAHLAAELGLVSQAVGACRATLALAPDHAEARALLARLEERP